MPPRIAPGSSRSRGRSVGAPPARAQPSSGPGDPPTPGAHITTVGVKRPAPGTNGRPIAIFVNSFPTSIPEGKIYHYDGA
jgi:eukaryotic translation initiation factor 2C